MRHLHERVLSAVGEKRLQHYLRERLAPVCSVHSKHVIALEFFICTTHRNELFLMIAKRVRVDFPYAFENPGPVVLSYINLRFEAFCVLWYFYWCYLLYAEVFAAVPTHLQPLVFWHKKRYRRTLVG
jgi:hypothetical protein